MNRMEGAVPLTVFPRLCFQGSGWVESSESWCADGGLCASLTDLNALIVESVWSGAIRTDLNMQIRPNRTVFCPRTRGAFKPVKNAPPSGKG